MHLLIGNDAPFLRWSCTTVCGQHALLVRRTQALRKQLTDEQDIMAVDKAAAALSQTFQAMIFRTRDAFLEKDEQSEVSFDAARDALQILRSYGERCDIMFPETETTEQIAAYILQFGRDVIFSNRSR